MKKLTYILIAIIVVGSGIALARKNIYQFIVTDHLDKEISEFELRDLQGNTIRSTDFKGKVLVLDFWTTWCDLCRKAFPEFQKVFERYKDYPEVAFLAVNTSQGGDSIEKVRAFVEANNYTFPFGYDRGAILSNELEIKHYPTLIIIDKTGKMRFKHIGYSKSFENYKLLLTKYIEQINR